MTERPIFETDPQPEVRRNVENVSDWECKMEATYLYGKSVL
jgi:hypothetical protein